MRKYKFVGNTRHMHPLLGNYSLLLDLYGTLFLKSDKKYSFFRIGVS